MTDLLSVKLKTYQLIILGAIGWIFINILFSFILYAPFLRYVVKSQKALKPGNEMRDVYLKLPMPLDFRVYFFNITNPSGVLEGQKPALKELGPYCYDAFKEKIIVEENQENDTLTYHPFDTYFFNKTRTGDLSQDDYVTILNPLVLGIINAVANTKPQFLSAVSKALPIIFKENYSLYITTRVRDILFDGVRIDCNVKDFSATAICSQFKGQSAMVEIEKNVFLFSLFGPRNGSNPQKITVYRGIKDEFKLGRVVSVNDQPDLGIWSEEECNRYNGTDGWVFPSFLKDRVYIVASDLCRNFEAKYVEDLRYNRVSVKKFYTDLGDSANPEEKCYCPTPESCLPKGVIDLTKCLQVPILCTLPHFLRADEKLLGQVRGLHPNLEKHIIQVYFEPVTGTPIMGQRRIQFNLQLQPVAKIGILKNVREALHPILWLQEGIELDGYFLDKMITISTLLKMVVVGRGAVFVICALLIGYGCFLGYKDWKTSQVSPLGADAEPEKKLTTVIEEFDLQSINENNLKNTRMNGQI